MLKRNEKLIRTKLLKYLAPAIMTNLALQVGNVVDTILVGNILGTNAMSAVQISGTILLVIQIPGRSLKSIDVMLSVTKDELVLRQRDDGIPFDPTCYSFDSEQYEYDGIEAIRALTDKITYLRTLDLNNTTLEISGSGRNGC